MKSKASDSVWQCKCGNIDYGEFPPEDCSKCLRVNKFKKIPEDQIEDAEAEEILSTLEEEENED